MYFRSEFGNIRHMMSFYVWHLLSLLEELSKILYERDKLNDCTDFLRIIDRFLVQDLEKEVISSSCV